jgi:hypothetical protein
MPGGDNKTLEDLGPVRLKLLGSRRLHRALPRNLSPGLRCKLTLLIPIALALRVTVGRFRLLLAR